MRKLVEKLTSAERQQDWTTRLNDYARDFSEGSRFLMGWRLGRLERSLGDAIAVQSARSE